MEILYCISLLPKGEGPTIVFPQHLEESGQILGVPGLRLRIQSNTLEVSPVRDDTTRGMRYESS